jgi:hypothetical protein
MNTESQILLYKKKISNYCLLLLVVIFSFGVFKAYNIHKSKIFSYETKFYSSLLNANKK